MDDKYKPIMESLAKEHKVPMEELVKLFDEKYTSEVMQKCPETIRGDLVARQVVAQFNAQANSSAQDFIVVVFGGESIKDKNSYNRKKQLDLYAAAQKQAEVSGDYSKLEQMDGSIISKKEDGTIVALYPATKKDGNPSAMAGKEIPFENSRVLYGIGYPAKSENPANDTKITQITLKGKAINDIPEFNKVLTIKGGVKEYNGQWQVNTSVAGFTDAQSEYIQEGLDNVGLADMVCQFMNENVMDYSDIDNIIGQFESIGENPLPPEMKWQTIANNVFISNLNKVPGNKDMCTVILQSTDLSAPNRATIIGKMDKDIIQKFNYMVGSEIRAFGRFNFMKGDNGTVILMEVYGLLPIKDVTIPGVEESQVIGKEEVKSDSEAEAMKPEDIDNIDMSDM